MFSFYGTCKNIEANWQKNEKNPSKTALSANILFDINVRMFKSVKCTKNIPLKW